MIHALRRVLGPFAASIVLVLVAGAGSETPPAGPPWKREFHAARAEAAEKGLPVFVYMTKTY
jgi:hypothetical protein